MTTRGIPRQQLDSTKSAQIAAVYANAAPGTIGGLIAATILSAMLVHLKATTISEAGLFIAIMFAQSLFRFALIRAYRHAAPAENDWQRWGRYAVATALFGGAAWGFGSLLIMDSTRPELQMMVLLVCAGMAAGAITAFGTYLPAYYGNLFCIMVPPTVWALLQGDVLHSTYAVLALLWTAVIAMLARTFSAILENSLRLQFENLELATSSNRQREIADQANVAKSRFLASASHDLRQPVHALGMFVGALKSRQLDREASRLVDQVEDSVASLDGLFTSLLDISRLDAGVVESRTRAFPVQPLLERIVGEESQEARRKGLKLILVPTTAIVKTDPLLLERILRNLVSNAVRYTESGRVLIGCRRAQQLSIEVWDTGPGISTDDQDLIFQEFYQVGNPERDRTKGLGLGLAIVRRLTAMLDTPLALQSVTGRGTVFKLSVPMAEASEALVTPPTGSLPEAAISRFIVVVDDEASIQEAMRTLLAAWGHRIETGGSFAEILKRIASSPIRPDLIICDYRLRDNESGIDVVQQLRSEFNEKIPAILMTGDTAPQRLKEASASDCLIMHKPVSNSRLRAAINNLTAGAQFAQ